MPVEIVQGTKSEYVDDPEGAKDEEGNVKKVSVDVPFVVNKTEPCMDQEARGPQRRGLQGILPGPLPHEL